MTLRVEEDGVVLRLTLDSPSTYNALTGETMVDLVEALHGAAVREDLRVVVLTGTGRAFSAGADLSGEGATERYDGDSVDGANTLVRAVTDLDKPVVCGLNGVAAGVGASLAMACDLVVAAASASLTLGFSRIGLMPDGGASALLPAAVGRLRAMRMALLSERIGAEEALAAGLVSHVFPDEEYADGLAGVVGACAAAAPLAFAATKKAINAATLDGLGAAMDRERAGQPVLLRTEDAAEGITAFAERRVPRFHGR
ncbi:enoyl-CoA hydratase [Marmoricola endophyticus]|uniref:Enoyl-CoA hydratase n=1 Tax=Marmoricola endophyticus TaxID=2040280 RepID=A0A917BWH9_9ACTN|nr:enoyl-CoA hydratase-related protein [Marmoricola endophyticus]GGF57386.1 enoyl-CoA hydratase [Marmoricola endophyticus]